VALHFICGGNGIGCTRALVPGDLSALTEGVVREGHMLREDRIPTGLTLLDEIG
jgi:hypothetical protein